MLITSLMLFVVIGMLAGTLSGLFGLGGGIVVVPSLAFFFLYHHTPHAMQLATGTSLAAMVLTTTSSVISHQLQKGIRWKQYRRFSLGLIIGVLGGVLLSHQLTSTLLHRIFGVALLFIVAKMVFYRPAMKKFARVLNILPSFILSLIISFISGLFGIGAGSIMLPTLNQYGFSMQEAAAISAVSSFTIALGGSLLVLTIEFSKDHLFFLHSTGYIYWPAFLGIVCGSIIFAPIGAYLSKKLPAILLQRLFAVILLCVSITMIW
jgi:uncharacterized membrane protein YfcA